MNGNNTMTKESFARAQAHPRKIELAKILLGESQTKKQDAIDSGFNEIIIQEMARDISRSVEGMENFDVELKNGTTQVEEATNEPTNETTNENQIPNEGNDQIDPDPSAEGQGVDPNVGAPTTSEGAPNQTNPQA